LEEKRRSPGTQPSCGENCLLFDVVLEKQSGKGSSVKIEQVSVTHVRSSVGVTESCTEYISPNPEEQQSGEEEEARDFVFLEGRIWEW
jgi:hypothetical protein